MEEFQHQRSDHTVQAESETQIHNQDKRVLQETNMRLKNKIIELVKQLDNKYKNESAASNMGGLNSVTGMTYNQNHD